MSTIRYIADWHYGHADIIAYDDRPFLKTEDMNAELIRRWNAVVAPEDTTYVVGDMFWCGKEEALSVLDRLNGTKILVVGNHDDCADEAFRSRFAAIDDYLEIRDGERDVVLCHYPIPCFKNHFQGWYHLYGHVHTAFEAGMMENVRRQMEALYIRPSHMYNVGAMVSYMDYTPRTLDEIVSGWQAHHK